MLEMAISWPRIEADAVWRFGNSDRSNVPSFGGDVAEPGIGLHCGPTLKLPIPNLRWAASGMDDDGGSAHAIFRGSAIETSTDYGILDGQSD